MKQSPNVFFFPFLFRPAYGDIPKPIPRGSPRGSPRFPGAPLGGLRLGLEGGDAGGAEHRPGGGGRGAAPSGSGGPGEDVPEEASGDVWRIRGKDEPQYGG